MSLYLIFLIILLISLSKFHFMILLLLSQPNVQSYCLKPNNPQHDLHQFDLSAKPSSHGLSHIPKSQIPCTQAPIYELVADSISRSPPRPNIPCLAHHQGTHPQLTSFSSKRNHTFEPQPNPRISRIVPYCHTPSTSPYNHK